MPTREMTDAEVDDLLERYDRTEPKLQRRIVAEFVARTEYLTLENGDLRDSTTELVDVLGRLYQGRMPDEVQKAFDRAKAALARKRP